MYLEEIIKIVKGKLLNDCKKNIKIKNIKFDSRKVKKNDLYIAIIGKNKNGHDFIDEAIKNGASIVIVSDNLNNYNIPTIKVDDTLEAMKNLAKSKIKKFNGTVIAITGSVGKTTTKELSKLVLNKKYNVFSNEGNKNNIYGLCETIFNLKKDTEILIVELGMNHKGEIDELSKICKPDIAIITNIGTSHIGNLKSRKNIFKAKMEIVNGMSKGKLIVNGDSKYLNRIKPIKDIELIKAGENKKNNLSCKSIVKENNSINFKIEYKQNQYEFKLNIPNEKLVINALMAITLGSIFQIKVKDIQKSLLEYKPQKGRYQIYTNKKITLIDDAYNSSYESLKASIESLNKNENSLLIIGEILELGKYSKKIHKKIGKLLNNKNYKVIVVGESMKMYRKKYLYFNNSNEVIDYLKKIDIKESKILIKGSNAVKLNNVSNYIIDKFDMKEKM